MSKCPVFWDRRRPRGRHRMTRGDVARWTFIVARASSPCWRANEKKDLVFPGFPEVKIDNTGWKPVPRRGLRLSRTLINQQGCTRLDPLYCATRSPDILFSPKPRRKITDTGKRTGAVCGGCMPRRPLRCGGGFAGRRIGKNKMSLGKLEGSCRDFASNSVRSSGPYERH